MAIGDILHNERAETADPYTGRPVIRLTTPLTSRSYVDMTVQTMQDFGITIIPTQDGWQIPGNQHYRCQNRYPVECDYSNAAFFLTAGAIGGRAADAPGDVAVSLTGDGEPGAAGACVHQPD